MFLHLFFWIFKASGKELFCTIPYSMEKVTLLTDLDLVESFYGSIPFKYWKAKKSQIFTPAWNH